MDREAFESLVKSAVAKLPREFLERLDNVEIVVEDVPNNRQLKRAGIKRPYQLLGLYEGVPQSKRGNRYGMVLPDKITIFRRPIGAVCQSTAEVVSKVQAVVKHEIAHHFGISDAQLKRIMRI
jgi:predicted Zn-dependent protease with MMP-like domain